MPATKQEAAEDAARKAAELRRETLELGVKIIVPQISPQARAQMDALLKSRKAGEATSNLLRQGDKIGAYLLDRGVEAAQLQAAYLRRDIDALRRAHALPAGAQEPERRRAAEVKRHAELALEALSGARPDVRKAAEEYRAAQALGLLNTQIRLARRSAGFEGSCQIYEAAFDALGRGERAKAAELLRCSELFLRSGDSAGQKRSLELAGAIHGAKAPADVPLAVSELGSRLAGHRLGKSKDPMAKKGMEMYATSAGLYGRGMRNEGDYAREIAARYAGLAGMGKDGLRRVSDATAFLNMKAAELRECLSTGRTLAMVAGAEGPAVKGFWKKELGERAPHFAALDGAAFNMQLEEARNGLPKAKRKDADDLVKKAGELFSTAAQGRAKGTMKEEEYNIRMRAASGVLESLAEEAKLRKAGLAREAERYRDAARQYSKAGEGTLSDQKGTLAGAEKAQLDADKAAKSATERRELDAARRKRFAQISEIRRGIERMEGQAGSAKYEDGKRIFDAEGLRRQLDAIQQAVRNAGTKAEMDNFMRSLAGLKDSVDLSWKRAERVATLERMISERSGLVSATGRYRRQLDNLRTAYKGLLTPMTLQGMGGMYDDIRAIEQSFAEGPRAMPLRAALKAARRGELSDQDMSELVFRYQSASKAFRAHATGWSRQALALKESLTSTMYAEQAKKSILLNSDMKAAAKLFRDAQMLYQDAAILTAERGTEFPPSLIPKNAIRYKDHLIFNYAGKVYVAKEFRKKEAGKWRNACQVEYTLTKDMFINRTMKAPDAEELAKRVIDSKPDVLALANETMRKAFLKRGSEVTHRAFYLVAREQMNEWQRTMQGRGSARYTEQLDQVLGAMIRATTVFEGGKTASALALISFPAAAMAREPGTSKREQFYNYTARTFDIVSEDRELRAKKMELDRVESRIVSLASQSRTIFNEAVEFDRKAEKAGDTRKGKKFAAEADKRHKRTGELKGEIAGLQRQRAELASALNEAARRGNRVPEEGAFHRTLQDYLTFTETKVKRDEAAIKAFETLKAIALIATSFAHGGLGLALWGADLAHNIYKSGEMHFKDIAPFALAAATHGASSLLSLGSRAETALSVSWKVRGVQTLSAVNAGVAFGLGADATMEALAQGDYLGALIAAAPFAAGGAQSFHARRALRKSAALQSRVSTQELANRFVADEAYAREGAKAGYEAAKNRGYEGTESEFRSSIAQRHNSELARGYAAVEESHIYEAYRAARKEGYTGSATEFAGEVKRHKRVERMFTRDAAAETAAQYEASARIALSRGPEAVPEAKAPLPESARARMAREAMEGLERRLGPPEGAPAERAMRELGRRLGPAEARERRPLRKLSPHEEWTAKIEKQTKDMAESPSSTPEALRHVAQSRNRDAAGFRKKAAGIWKEADRYERDFGKGSRGYRSLAERALRMEEDARLYERTARTLDAAAEGRSFGRATDAQKRALYVGFMKAYPYRAMAYDAYVTAMGDYHAARVRGEKYASFDSYLRSQRSRALGEAMVRGAEKAAALKGEGRAAKISEEARRAVPEHNIVFPPEAGKAREAVPVGEVPLRRLEPVPAKALTEEGRAAQVVPRTREALEILEAAKQKIANGDTFVSGDDIVTRKAGGELHRSGEYWTNEKIFNAVRDALLEEARVSGRKVDAVVVALDKSGLNNIDHMATEVADAISRRVFGDIVRRAREILARKYGRSVDALLGNGKCDERTLIVVGEFGGRDVVADIRGALKQAKSEVMANLDGYGVKVSGRKTTVGAWMRENAWHGEEMAVAHTAEFSRVERLSPKTSLADMYKSAEESAAAHARPVADALGIGERGALRPRPGFDAKDMPGQALPAVADGRKLQAGTALEVTISIRPEHVAKVQAALAKHLLEMGEARLRQRYSPDEVKDLLALARAGRVPLKEFARLALRKGRLFQSTIGFSEGNTWLGHHAMDALAQLVVDAAAARVGGARGGRSMGNLSFFVPEEIAAGRRSAADIQAAIARSLEGSGFTVRVKALEVRAGETPAGVHARLLADGAGVKGLDAKTRDAAEKLVRVLNGGSDAAVARALRGAPPEVRDLAAEIRPPKITVEKAPQRRDLRRLRDVLDHLDPRARQALVDFVRKNARQIDKAAVVPKYKPAKVGAAGRKAASREEPFVSVGAATEYDIRRGTAGDARVSWTRDMEKSLLAKAEATGNHESILFDAYLEYAGNRPGASFGSFMDVLYPAKAKPGPADLKIAQAAIREARIRFILESADDLLSQTAAARGMDGGVLLDAYARFRAASEKRANWAGIGERDIFEKFSRLIDRKAKRSLSDVKLGLPELAEEALNDALAGAAAKKAKPPAPKAPGMDMDELKGRFAKDKVDEIIRASNPVEARDLLGMDYIELEVKIAMDRYGKESAAYFRENVLNAGKDADLVASIKSGGYEAGERYLGRRGYSKTAIIEILGTEEYGKLAEEYNKRIAREARKETQGERKIDPEIIRAVRDRLPKGAIPDEGNLVVLNEASWKKLAELPKEDSAFIIEKLLEIAHRMRRLNEGESFGSLVAGDNPIAYVNAKGGNQFSIEFGKGDRVIFYPEDGQIKVHFTETSARKAEYNQELTDIKNMTHDARGKYLEKKMAHQEELMPPPKEQGEGQVPGA